MGVSVYALSSVSLFPMPYREVLWAFDLLYKLNGKQTDFARETLAWLQVKSWSNPVWR